MSVRYRYFWSNAEPFELKGEPRWYDEEDGAKWIKPAQTIRHADDYSLSGALDEVEFNVGGLWYFHDTLQWWPLNLLPEDWFAFNRRQPAFDAFSPLFNRDEALIAMLFREQIRRAECRKE